MKKALKITGFLLVLTMVFTCLCGCDSLDELRKSTGTYTSSSDIRLGNDTYKKLTYSENLSVKFGVESVDKYIMREEVPLLLSTFLGDYYILSEDGIFLQDMENENYTVYCRSDYFEQVNTQLEKGLDIKKYAYEYYIYDDGYYEGEYASYELEPDEVKAVLATLQGEGEPLADDMNILFDYFVWIDGYSEDGLLYEHFCDIYVYEGQYSIVLAGEENTVYRVPKEMNGIFEKLVSKHVESEQFWLE